MKNLKFHKTLSQNGIRLPNAVFRVSGFGVNEEAEVRPIQDAVVILKRHMTALELVSVAQSLHALSMELAEVLIKACGLCRDCEAGCPQDAPDQLLRQGLSADTLEALLEAGVCLGQLAKLTKGDRVIYG